METVVLRGIVTVNFELEIDVDDFAEICENNCLDPENINKFSKSDWLAIRSGLEAIVENDEQNIVNNYYNTKVNHINFFLILLVLGAVLHSVFWFLYTKKPKLYSVLPLSLKHRQ